MMRTRVTFGTTVVFLATVAVSCALLYSSGVRALQDAGGGSDPFARTFILLDAFVMALIIGGSAGFALMAVLFLVSGVRSGALMAMAVSLACALGLWLYYSFIHSVYF